MKTEPSKTNTLLKSILQRDGVLHECNAPQSWVNLAHELERELNAANETSRVMCRLHDESESETNELKERMAAMPNGQKLSHAAGDFRQPETRSDNGQA